MPTRALDDTDRRVARLLARDDIRAARERAAQHVRIAHGKDVPDEAWPAFDGAMDEWAANYLRKAIASDPGCGRFIADFLPPAGESDTGSRIGGDNPDNRYRLAGIDPAGRYRVTGRTRGTAPASTSFTLVGNWGTSVTVDGIEADALECAPDGRFSFTIGSAEGEGGPHLVSQPHAKFLFVRDTMSDWAEELPYELAIERLDVSAPASLDDDAIAAAAGFRMVEDVPLYFWFQRIFSGREANTMGSPFRSGGLGGLVTQAGCHGRVQLQEDECALIRFGDAGAAYAAFQLADWWFRSIDAHLITSSLTTDQAVPKADGSYELVIARRDPGVANWLDTSGLANCLVLGRWQGLPQGGEAPAATMQVIKIADLDISAAAGGPMDAAARKAQIAARRSHWSRRDGEGA